MSVFAASTGFYAQTGGEKKAEKNLPSVSLGAGLLTFHGDVGKKNLSSTLASIRAGYYFKVEQKFAGMLGVSLNATYGKIAKEQRDTIPANNLNFETPLMQFGLGLTFYFDNDKIMKKDFPVSPYIFTGFNYLMFDPHGDLRDETNNIDYYYWKDGSIRDLPELPGNEFISQTIKRDYTYETQLKDTVANYARTTFTLPVGIGFGIKLCPSLEISLNSAYHIALSDYLDNKKEGGNDAFLYNYVAVKFNFGKREREDGGHSNIDWKSIDLLDADGDGVIDTDDLCPGSEKGIKVNSKGCPPDDDEDGVPDYRDKEPKSKKGLGVDADGVTLTEEKIKQLFEEKETSVEERKQQILDAPSLITLENIDKQIEEQKKKEKELGVQTKLPDEFRSADKNGDGIISSQEINMVIDGFFDGSSDFTVERIHRLIDYFFEQ
jgi:hypothetical protein